MNQLVLPQPRLLRWLLERSFAPLFAVYVYMLVLLPSGSIFGVNVKMLCFALLLCPTLFWMTRQPRFTQKRVALVLVVPAVLMLWILVGQFHAADFLLSVNQYKDIWTTLVSCWVATVYCQERADRSVSFLRMVLFAEVSACFLKVALLGYCLATGTPVAILVDTINSLFKVNLMGMDFESALGRIQFIADGLIPLCLYLLLRYRERLRVGKLPAVIFFLALALSLVFTFSRYLWVFGVLALCVGVAFSRWDKFHAWLLLIAGLCVLAALPALVTLYQLRTSAAVAGDSDSVRTLQIPALVAFFLDAPFLGHGLGSYTSAVVRSGELPYVYEVQLYALAGQIGLLGMLLITALTATYFLPLWPRHWQHLNQKASLGLLLLAFLAAGFFNPMLLNSASAMFYAAVRALALVDNFEASGAATLAKVHAPLRV